MKKNNADLLIDMLLHFPKLDNVFNPLIDFDEKYDASKDSPVIRKNQLTSYIHARVEHAKVVILTEAYVSKDAKFTGIAMTDERTLLSQSNYELASRYPILDIEAKRTSAEHFQVSKYGMGDLSSAVLYHFLFANKIDPRTVMTWNAFPFHTHYAEDTMTNRPTKLHEIEAANHIHREFFSVFEGCAFITIGEAAAELLEEFCIECHHIKNPSLGTPSIFTQSLSTLLKPSAAINN